MKNAQFSVVIIDNDEIDSYINKKLLLEHGVTNVTIYNNAITALIHLRKGEKRYDIILVSINLPVMDGFEFIDSYNRSQLYDTHGKIYLLSATINPTDKTKSEERNIPFIEKPLKIDKLVQRAKSS